MKKIKRLQAVMALALFLFCLTPSIPGTETYASDGEEYITITVDAEDDNDNLMYALDSTQEDAFTSSNTFTIPAGTSHIIYVRDAAGNITSQEYSPLADSSSVEITSGIDSNSVDAPDTQDITIDLEINNEKDYSDYEYLTDSPAEPGSGTLHSKVKTDGSDDSEKVFYTVTTAEGDVFYMVIDQNQSDDNVYLLNTVTRNDLQALAADGSQISGTDKEEDNLLAALSDEKDTGTETVSSSRSNTSRNNMIVMLLIIAAIGGVYYYMKVYKNKKDEAMDIMDAMDMEDFEPEEEEEDEEAEFETDDEDKQEYLDHLIGEEDEALFDMDPDEYADEDEYIDKYYDGQDEYAPEAEDTQAEEEGSMIFPEDASLAADFAAEYDEELDGEEE